MARVQDKVAFVTGGASGIGRAAALALAGEGARLVVTDLNEQDGAAVASEIEAAGGEALFLRHDATSESDWAAAVESALGRFGQIDVMVNNAGLGFVRPIVEMTMEEWRRVMAVNLDGVFLGTKAAITTMAPRGGGSIINVSSILGIVGTAGASAYSASKGGVRMLTKSAAVECAQAGLNIRVNSVHPGYIDTPMVQGALGQQPDPAASRALIESRHPVNHLGEPADIAQAIVYLASDDAKFVTGTNWWSTAATRPGDNNNRHCHCERSEAISTCSAPSVRDRRGATRLAMTASFD